MSSVLIARLNRHARLRPDALAIREIGIGGAERVWSWGAVRDSAWATARALRESSSPATVMIAAPNGAGLLVGILGGLWAGASVLPVSPDLPAPELSSLARRAGVDTLMGDRRSLEAARDLPVARIPLAGSGSPSPSAEPDPRVEGGAILLKSSGSTGSPKIVRRDAPALDAVGRGCARAIGVSETDCMLVAIPLHHSYGIDQAVLTAVREGCALELHQRFDRARVAATLAEGRASLFPAVPWIFDALTRRGRGPTRAPGLRRAYSAGSPLPPRIRERFEEAYGVRIGEIYGATEFGSVTFNDPDASGFLPESVGLPLEGVELRILDPEASRIDRPLPPGHEGHVAVSASSMLSEYVDEPGPATEGGFLLTGDLGRLEPGGRLVLTGRLKFLIDVGGIKVNPLEVETVLMRHPAVREAVALAVPHTETVSRVKAVIVPENGFRPSGRELQAFARQHLIHYMVPRSFEIRASLPRTPTGKVLREQLQAEIVLGSCS